LQLFFLFCSFGADDGGAEHDGGEEGGGRDNKAMFPADFDADLLDTDVVDDDVIATDLPADAAVVPLPVAYTLLQHAGKFVEDYSSSTVTHDVSLPSALSGEDRQVLHAQAERLGLAHRSEGVLHERHLVLSKRDYGRDGNLAAAAAAGDAGQGGVLSSGCDPNWGSLRVKYDARHW
jgi:hypothetical protein